MLLSNISLFEKLSDFDKIWYTTADNENILYLMRFLEALSQYLRCGKDVIRYPMLENAQYVGN